MSFPGFSASGWLPFVRALLHTLWLGGLAAGGLSLALRTVPARRGTLRYGLCMGALAGVLLAGVGAWAWGVAPARVTERPSHPASLNAVASPAAATSPTGDADAVATEPQFQNEVSPLEETPWVRWTAAGWLAGVVVCLWRVVRGVVGADRLRRRCQPLIEPGILALAESLCASLGLERRVRLLVSAEIAMPAVMGVVWPVILLPAAMISGVPAETWRAVLGHELAHIRRWDYLVNLGQMIIEALLFFNPFVWWISRQGRLEREACCDQFAAAQCGSPVRYVESLLTVIEHSRTAVAGAASPWLAIDGPAGGREDSALDRVRRLLVPGYLPVLRVRWYSLAGVLALAAGGLTALFVGAWSAARALSPQERIERITRLNGDYAPPEYAPVDCTVSGRVTAADGAALDGPATVDVRSQTTRISSVQTQRETGRDGTFSFQSKRGLIHVAAFQDGYAPTFLGPFNANRDKLEGLAIVLNRWFAASIQTVDEAGQPVAGVALSGYYVGPPSANVFKRVTDGSGTAVIAHAAAAPVNLHAELDGFQPDAISDFRPDAARTFRWVLKKSTPLPGTVVSTVTGQPIIGAKVKLARLYEAPMASSQYDPGDAPVLATTDRAGRFTLNRLRVDGRYAVYVEAAGYGGVLRRGVQATGPPLAVVLGPELFVRGKVVNAGAQAGADGKIRLEYGQAFTFDHGTNTRTHDLKLTLRNGEADFALGPLYDAPVEIRLDKQIVKLQAAELPKSDLRIDLGAESAPREIPVKTRLVIFRFGVPWGSPPATGSVLVSYSPLDSLQHGRNESTSRDIPIQNGVARMEVGLPNSLDFWPTGLVGYTFTEQHHQSVAEGSGPLTIDVPVQPAGAIFGEVQAEDGLPMQGMEISTHVVTPSGSGDADFRVPDVQTRADRGELTGGRFAVSPLPLEKTYVLVARRELLFAASEPLRLSASTPVRRVKLLLPKGQTAQGRMVDETGAPAVGIPFSPIYQFPGAGGRGMQLRTDADGRFTIPHLNFDAPGTYTIDVNSRSRYQPAIWPLKRGEAETLVRLHTGKTLSGTLVDDATGFPVTGAEVYAQYADNAAYQIGAKLPTPGVLSFDAEGKSDDLGRFHFSNLPAAQVYLGTREVNPADPSHRVAVTPGQPEPVTFRVRMIPGSEARVVAPR